MSIDTAINQKSFRSEHQKAIINLIYTFNWMNGKHKVILNRCNLTPQQFNILRILRGAGEPLSTLQIRQRMLDKMSDTSRIVDRMIIKGLLKKMVSKTDKRLVDIILSDKGKSLLAQSDQYQDELDGVVKNLSPDEAAALNALLDKLRADT